jgi:hypothetical protein
MANRRTTPFQAIAAATGQTQEARFLTAFFRPAAYRGAIYRRAVSFRSDDVSMIRMTFQEPQ